MGTRKDSGFGARGSGLGIARLWSGGLRRAARGPCPAWIAAAVAVLSGGAVARADDECCTSHLECQDGLWCSGIEWCDCWGQCLAGVRPNCDDGNDCTVDNCVNTVIGTPGVPGTGGAPGTPGEYGEGMCEHVYVCGCTDDADCADGNACTDDSCNRATGTCEHAVADCDDGNSCTTDSCDPLLGCSNVPIPGCCRSDPECHETPTDNPCTTDTCDVGTGTCSHADVAAGTPCPPDGNACTNDVCDGAGTCGTPRVCSDGNVCTDDSCNPASGCVFTNNSAPCNDGSLCTIGDVCSGGVCRGSARDCDDANVCTDDGCNPLVGCTHANNTAPCSDGNACTNPDACSGGACRAGPAVACNDGNVCTNDSCNPASGCVYVNNTAPCEDGNLCTVGDACSGGSCRAGSARDCNDGNVCTNDSCTPALGCTYTYNTSPCSDGNACTNPDACSGGSCRAGPAVTCNDGNVCTDDSCVPATGCRYVNNTAPCSDGNACTNPDACSGGSCRAGPPRDCNDGNVCTIDTCVAASGCSYSGAPPSTVCTPSGSPPSPAACYAGRCNPATWACTWQFQQPANDACAPAPLAAQEIALDGAYHGRTTGNNTCAADNYAGSCRSTGGGKDLVYHFAANVGEDFQLYAYRTYLDATFDSVLYDRRASCTGSQVICNDDCVSNTFLNCSGLGLGARDSAFVIHPRPIGTNAYNDWLFQDAFNSADVGGFTVDVQRIAFENGIPCEIGANPAYYYQPDATLGGRFRGHLLPYPTYRNVTGCAGSPYYQSRVYGPTCWYNPADTSCFSDRPCWPYRDPGCGFFSNRRYRETQEWPANAWFLIRPTSNTRYRVTVNDTSAIPSRFDAVISLKSVAAPMDCPRYITYIGCASLAGTGSPTTWDLPCLSAGTHYEVGVSRRVIGDAGTNYEVTFTVLGGC